MKRPPGFHSEVPFFPLPSDGGGKGGGDNVLKFNDFIFYFLLPLTPPLSRKGRGGFRIETT